MAIIVGTSGNDTLLGGVEADSLDGLEGDDHLDGSFGADSLNGGLGNDTLIGGELGALLGDTLTGGAGDDVYEIANPFDQIVEVVGEGVDEVRTGLAAYTLGDNVETLTYTGGDAFTGTGNDLDNRITGGAGADSLIGGAGADTLIGGGGADTLVGGIGDDRYRIDNTGVQVVETAGGGGDTVLTSLAAYTLGDNVETLTYTGGGSFTGVGNDLDNVIQGGTGADTLAGGLGFDTLIGGAGNDLYLIDDVADLVVENAGEGVDEVRTSLSAFTLAPNVEVLTYTGAGDFNGVGGAGNDTLHGGGGADTLVGAAGNDSLDGGAGADVLDGGSGADTLNGGLGADSMAGGTGNDTYYVDDLGDVVTELSGEGSDTVRSALDYTLGDNVESLVLTGSAVTGTGNGLNNSLTGTAADNLLTGLDGNDTLNGGAGADTLIGGTGNDTYVVDNVGDVLVELPGEGVDTVQSSITHTLLADFENLTLTGSAAINGVGNAANNALTGNGAANLLTGLDGDDTLNGGAGADSLVGGTGDDLYVVDNAGDVVTEWTGEGVDTVNASVSWTLGDNLEKLTLTGSASINGTGNDLDNVLTGNSGANILDGGLGADTMVGGAGNDVYLVDSAGDVVTEAAGQGTDELRTALAAYTLGANVETLTYTGTGPFSGGGNALDNRLAGAGGDDSLSGFAGDDTLIGGAGADTLDGGSGTDTASYAAAASGVVVDLASGAGTAGEATGDVLVSIENLTGSAYADTLSGDGTANLLDGGAGADSLSGGAGNDTLIGGAGADAIDGGAGTDTASYATASAGVAVDLASGTGTAGDAAGDVLIGIENVTGGAGNDTLRGDGGANLLDGGAGDDALEGRGGSDTLIGGSGTDTAVFSGNVRDYAATLSGATWTIQALSGADGTDTLQGVEIAQFADATIRLDANNAPLIPNDLSAATNEDAAPLVVDLLQGAWDFEGSALSATGLVQTGGPTATVSLSGGALSLNPNQFNSLAAGQTAALTFAYAVSDGAASAARTLAVTVAGRNDAPVASGPVNAATNEDAAPLVVNLLQGATDPDQGDTLSVTGFTQTGGRTVSVTRTGGALTLDPAQFNDLAAGESATLTFGYGVTDGTATTAQTMNVTVQGRNDAPVAGADSFTTTYQTPLIIATNSLLANDADPEGRTLAITALGGASNGTVQFDSDGNIVFVPLDGYHGNATFQYTVTDPQGATATATATIAVQDRIWGSGTGGTLVSKPETKVNGTASGSLSSLTRLSDGGYVIAWTGVQSSGGDWDIFARRYDAHDQPVGAEFRVNTTTSQNQSDPQVAALAGGGFVVGWSGSDGSARGFFGQRYDASGASVGGEFRANVTTANDQGPSQITALRDGGYVMTWSSLAQDGDGSWASEARVFNADGAPRTGEFRLNAYTNWDQLAPVVATVSDTEFLAVWSSRGQDGSGWGGIMGRRFSTATGQALSGEFQINTTTVNDQFKPRAIGLNDGTYVIAWQSYAQDGSGWGVIGQRIQANGTKIGGEFAINNNLYLDQDMVDLAPLKDGGFVAAWESQGQDDNGYGIYAQRFSAQGSRVGEEFLVNQTTVGDQAMPQLIGRSDGGFTVSWYSSAGSALDAYSRTFTFDHQLAPVVTVANTTLALATSVAAKALIATGHPQGAEGVRAGFGSITQYELWDGTAPTSSGHFTVNGVAQSALQPIVVSAADLGKVAFVAGSVSGSDIIRVRGFDGVTWSDWQSASITALPSVGQSGNLVAGQEQRINESASGSIPVSTRLADGGYVVAWSGATASGDWNIYGRRFDATGRPLGVEFRVNTVTSQNQSDPVITALAGGGFVIGWSGSDGSNRGFFGQRYDAAGLAVGSEFIVNRTLSSDQAPSSLTALRDGGFVASWSSLAQDGDGSWASIGRVYNADGTGRTDEFRLNAYTPWDQQPPVVATVSDTEFLAVWSSRGQDGSGWGGIMGRRFSTTTGQALSGEFQINTTTVNDQYRPRMVALADSTFLVAWHSYAQDGSGWGVFGQRIQENGTKLGGEFRMNSQTASDQFRVEMAALQDGGFVAVWESQGQDGSAGGVYAQRYAIQTGVNQPQAVGSEFLVAQVTAGDQGYPTVSALPDGGYTVSWQSNASGQYQVQSRNFAGAISPRWIAGTAAGDTLTGFGGADTISGGLGSDTLTGGLGADAFRFASPLDGTDTITDFQPGIDRIEVVGSTFGSLPTGQLDTARFALNTPGDADDRFVFNTGTGTLSYDPDGSGTMAATTIALLNVRSLSASDIWVVASA